MIFEYLGIPSLMLFDTASNDLSQKFLRKKYLNWYESKNAASALGSMGIDDNFIPCSYMFIQMK